MPKPRSIKYYIGIDIGNDGAIVVQNSVDSAVKISVMPLIGNTLDLHELYSILRFYESKDCHVVFEDLHAIFGASAGSTFNFGGSAKAIEMCVIALGLPFTKIKAVVWQKEMFVGVKEMRKPSTFKTKKTKAGLVEKIEVKGRVETKLMALLAAKRLFPTVPLLKSTRSTKPHDGIVDALLISEYAKRNFK